MKIYLFYHSIVSDWNHGNAHFLRGMVTSLISDGHKVIVYEPINGWSFTNMIKDAGVKPIYEYVRRFPLHEVKFYEQANFTCEILNDADLVIVHEWNTPDLIHCIGQHRKSRGKYILLFHDTHHRSVSDTINMNKTDLSGYDGVLAYGDTIREIYLKNNWSKNVWTWHEAADRTIFSPIKTSEEEKKDLVWIGNWGENERSEEIKEFIINPVKELGLKAIFYGVRYPSEAIKSLNKANIEYRGWLPNYSVPQIFSNFRITVHVPRRFYVKKLKGIPTIRPFEAMACGIPLISSPWNDSENLFRANIDYLVVRNGSEMKKALLMVLNNPDVANNLISNALETISSKHTCDHRKEELLKIVEEIKLKKIKKQLVV